jgi:isocitrate lyase
LKYKSFHSVVNRTDSRNSELIKSSIRQPEKSTLAAFINIILARDCLIIQPFEGLGRCYGHLSPHCPFVTENQSLISSIWYMSLILKRMTFFGLLTISLTIPIMLSRLE